LTESSTGNMPFAFEIMRQSYGKRTFAPRTCYGGRVGG